MFLILYRRGSPATVKCIHKKKGPEPAVIPLSILGILRQNYGILSPDLIENTYITMH